MPAAESILGCLPAIKYATTRPIANAFGATYVAADRYDGQGDRYLQVCRRAQMLAQVVELTADSGTMTPSTAAAATVEGDLDGVPALPACRVKLVWEADPRTAAEVRWASIFRFE